MLIPNLYRIHGPCVVVDPKGELQIDRPAPPQGIRAPHHPPRSLQRPGAGRDTLNPLDFIDPGGGRLPQPVPGPGQHARGPDGQEKDPHWNDSAE